MSGVVGRFIITGQISRQYSSRRHCDSCSKLLASDIDGVDQSRIAAAY
jgi:hypothetical protein